MSGDDVDSANQVTRRERQIARLYADGQTYKAIANSLFISPATVRTHICSIYRKLGVGNKVELLKKLDRVTNVENPVESRAQGPYSRACDLVGASLVVSTLGRLGLDRYLEVFLSHAIDDALFATLTDQDLREIGIEAKGHRKKLLQAIDDLAAGNRPRPSTPEHTPAPQAGGHPVAHAERRHLTVIFVDLVGSTAMAMRLDPEQMSDVLRAYQNAVVEQVGRFAGHVAHFMGDGVLVYFGWPEAQEDEAERAVRAARAILQAIGQVVAPDGARIQARIGIASGLVVVGGTASTGQLGDVVGGTPSLAARLQSVAAPNQVVIAGTAAEFVRPAFALQSLGKHRLKGFDAEIEVFAVGDELATSSRFDARRGQGMTPLVGRTLELALLADLWRRVQEGEGQVAILVGDAGIGKSRISRAFLDSVDPRPASVDLYQCSPFHIRTSLHPFVEHLSQHLRSTAGTHPECGLESLAALLETVDTHCDLALPLLADLLSLQSGGDGRLTQLEPKERRRLTLNILSDLAIGQDLRQPKLLIIEDLHWLDPTSAELVARLVELAQTGAFLLVMTTRPEPMPSWPTDTHISVLTLHRLSNEQATELVGQLSAPKRLSDVLTHEIVAKTDGVPLFIEELTKTVLESGSVVDLAGRRGRDAPIDIPVSLHDTLVARLDRLGPARHVAQIAAVIGREFSRDLLGAVAELPEDELERSVDRLLRAGLVMRRGRGDTALYSFKHALIHDAAYGTLLFRDRRTVHGRIVDALGAAMAHAEPSRAGQFAEPQDKQFAILAHHALKAERWLDAAKYHRLAGGAARERWSIQEAIHHFERTLLAFNKLAAEPGLENVQRRSLESQRLETTISLCECLYFEGRFQASFDRAMSEKSAFDQLDDLKLRGQGRYWLARLASRLGRHNLTRRVAAEAITDGSSCVDWLTTGKAYSVLSVEYFFSGQPDESIAAGRRAIDCLERYGLSESLGFSYHYIILAQILAGRFLQAIELCQKALDIADRLRHPRLECYALSDRGWASGMAGRFEHGRRDLEAALHVAPDAATRTFVTGYLGCVLLEAGDIDDAISMLRPVTENCRAFPSPQYASFFGATLAEAERQRQTADAASEAAEIALRFGRGASFPFGTGLATRVLGRIAADAGDHDTAVSLIGDTIRILSSAGADFEAARTYADLACLAERGVAVGMPASDCHRMATDLLRRLGLASGAKRFFAASSFITPAAQV